MKNPSTIATEIERLEDVLTDLDPVTDDYAKVRDNIDKLVDIRTKNEPKFQFDVDGNTIVLASVNLLGILLVLNHEVLHALPSKALGFITKLRI